MVGLFLVFVCFSSWCERVSDCGGVEWLFICDFSSFSVVMVNVCWLNVIEVRVGEVYCENFMLLKFVMIMFFGMWILLLCRVCSVLRVREFVKVMMVLNGMCWESRVCMVFVLLFIDYGSWLIFSVGFLVIFVLCSVLCMFLRCSWFVVVVMEGLLLVLMIVICVVLWDSMWWVVLVVVCLLLMCM